MSTTIRPTRDRATGSRTPGQLDPRGPQVAATLTAAVLIAVLLLPAPVSTVLLGVQAVIFALGAVRGVQATPYAWVFRTLVRPRLAPPTDWEDPEPPRFAQGVGLAFAVVGLVALLLGATLVGQVAVGAALVAALLNAVFGFCLGCEVYLITRRMSARTN